LSSEKYKNSSVELETSLFDANGCFLNSNKSADLISNNQNMVDVIFRNNKKNKK
jgi:hypothetical protein